jgi:tRNA(Arg) A34 adenosine deaminase TadA
MTLLASSATNKSNAMVLPVLLASAGAAVAASVITHAATKRKLLQTKRGHEEDTNDDCDATNGADHSGQKNDQLHHSVKVTLPEWAKEEIAAHAAKTFVTDEEMMALAIHLSSRNVTENTGGPFGCAIFERDLKDNTAKLVSVGVNRVVALGNSTLHGETVAIQLAQSKLNSFTMQLPVEEEEGESPAYCVPCKKTRQFELFTSCEPCAMCLGATLWSGVSRIVCGATKKDAEAIGFDEGPVFAESYEHLKKAGIDVKKLVLQPEAAQVLNEYGKIGTLY